MMQFGIFSFSAVICFYFSYVYEIKTFFLNVGNEVKSQKGLPAIISFKYY